MSAFAGVTVSSQSASAPILIKMEQHPYLGFVPCYSLGLICTVSSGASLTYSVQVTADQVPSASGNWNNHDVLVLQTASANSNIAYPVTAVRVNVTAYSSGSVNLGIAKWP